MLGLCSFEPVTRHCVDRIEGEASTGRDDSRHYIVSLIHAPLDARTRLIIHCFEWAAARLAGAGSEYLYIDTGSVISTVDGSQGCDTAD